jgi:hypothetical protein
MWFPTVFPLYGLHDGNVPYSENTPWNPHRLAIVHFGPRLAGSKSNWLRLTSMFWVFQRQSE